MTAFSNGFEWDCWSSAWCHKCKNDINEDCPIVLDVFINNEPPKEWTEVNEMGLADRYECSKFEPIGD